MTHCVDATLWDVFSRPDLAARHQRKCNGAGWPAGMCSAASGRTAPRWPHLYLLDDTPDTERVQKVAVFYAQSMSKAANDAGQSRPRATQEQLSEIARGLHCAWFCNVQQGHVRRLYPVESGGGGVIGGGGGGKIGWSASVGATVCASAASSS